MTFLNPALAAAGLACVTLPILIHLLMRRRRKPVRWAAMLFLQEALRKHRRALTVRQWILLATRTLVVLLIALAIGRPSVGAAANPTATGPRTVYLLIDNSLTAAIRTPDGTTALDAHKQTARQLINDLGPADRVAVIGLATPPTPLVLPATLDRAAAAAAIEDIPQTDARAAIESALAIAAAAITEDSRRDQSNPGTPAIALISESRRGSAPIDRPLSAVLPAAIDARLIAIQPAQTDSPNTAITALEPLRSLRLTTQDAADTEIRLRATLERFGSEATPDPAQLTAALDADPPTAPARAEATWSRARTTTSATLSITATSLADPTATSAAPVGRFATVRAQSDALPRDDTRTVQLISRDRLRVLILGEPPTTAAPAGPADLPPEQWLTLALTASPTSPVEIRRAAAGAIDPPSLDRADAIILTRPDLVTDEGWAALAQDTREGGLLWLMPPADATVNLWTDAFNAATGLDWPLEREPVALNPDAPEPGLRLDTANLNTANAGLLAALASELPDLARAVRIRRALSLARTPPRANAPLTLESGSPWLITARPPSTAPITPTAANNTKPQQPSSQTTTQPPEGPDPAAPATSGLIVYTATPPDLAWTNLPLMPLMVALTQEIVRRGISEAAAAGGLTAGDSLPAAPPRSLDGPAPTGAVVWQSPAGTTHAPGEPARTAGLWTLTDPAGRTVTRIPVNPDTRASNTTAQNPDALAAYLAGAFDTDTTDQAPVAVVAEDAIAQALLSTADPPTGDASAARDAGAGIAPWFLAAALALALAELVLARRFSAPINPTGGADA